MVWKPLALARWEGTGALADAHCVQGGFASLYIRRSRLEQNKAAAAQRHLHASLAAAHEDVAAYAMLVEFTCASRPVMNGLFDLAVEPLGGLKVALPRSFEFRPRGPGPPLRLSLTVLRQRDGKLMRVCKEAEVDTSTIDPDYVSFEMGGDFADSLTHPVLWSVINDPVVHHIGLMGVRWGDISEEVPESISSFESIFIGLADPRDLISEEGPARVLTAWREVGEWV